MKRKPTTLPLGTISHGTLKAEHLLNAFTYELGRLHLSKKDRICVREYQKLAENLRDEDFMPLNGKEDIESALEKLYEILESGVYCLPYTYFGTLEGDASDFGIWPDHESISDDVIEGDLPMTDDVTKGYTGLALETNDHGNMTLFTYTHGRRRILWSIV